MLKTIYGIIALFIILFMSSNSFAGDQLVFSLDLVRHGDRAPLNQIPNSYQYWKEGLGELTETGIYMESQLGMKLRRLYVDQYHLLPKIYDASTIYVRSTDTKRAIQSADALLLGLYPLNTRGLLNQMIPIKVVPIGKDNLLIVKPSKNIFAIINRYFNNRNFWKEKTLNIQNKLDYWAKQTGMSLKNSEQIDRLADNLYVRKLHHLALPKGINEDDASKIVSLNDAIVLNDFKLPEVSFPTGQEFLKTVVNYLKLKMQNKSPIKYVLLSGHDSSIMGVISTLGASLEQRPSYASRLNFAFIKSENTYFIKISYNDKPVYIPACRGTTCTLTQLDKLIN